MTPQETLRTAGEALYGHAWQAELARALGLSDPRRIREWMTRGRTIPPGVWSEIAALLRERSCEQAQLAADIESGALAARGRQRDTARS